MSSFRMKTLVGRAKMLTTFLKGSSVAYKMAPRSQLQNQSTRSFSMRRWRETIEAWSDLNKSLSENIKESDDLSVPPDLQGDIGPYGDVLPKELWRSVVKLSCESSAGGGICDVYVVGTCHISEKSSQEVKAIIGILKPEVVFLELCVFGIGVLSGKKQVSSRLGVTYNREFHVAYEEAKKLGSKVLLGDRPTKFEPTLSSALRQRTDPIQRAWLDERDQYMSARLLKIAREHNSVVAVVGFAHLEGIKKYWKQPTELQLQIHGAMFEIKGETLHIKLRQYEFHSLKLGVVVGI